MNILLAVIALSFLIIVHEFGHFIVAKLSGIKVLEFSLFMGPKLFSTQKGETLYSIRLVPLGGFVRMEGEEEASEDNRAYNKKPIPVRLAVIAAGPLMNLIIGVLLIAITSFNLGYQTNHIGELPKESPAQKVGIQKGDQLVSFDNHSIVHPLDVALFSSITKKKPVKVEVKRQGKRLEYTVAPMVIPAQKAYRFGIEMKSASGADSNVINRVVDNKPAQRAGMKAGDRIVGINDVEITDKVGLDKALQQYGKDTLSVTVERGGVRQPPIQVKPDALQIPEQYYHGLEFQGEKGGIWGTLKSSTAYGFSIARSVYYSLIWLVSGKVSPNQLMGPVGIVSTVGDVVEQGTNIMEKIFYLFNFMALISINLGIFNLIPFPALDGSKILLMVVEAVRRKPIPVEKEAAITMVGFVLLISLMLFATWNDIMRIFTNQ